MNNSELVAVTSRSFSKHSVLRARLKERFSRIKFNEEGIKLTDKALIDFLRGATRAIIGLEIIDDSVLNCLPDLKAICKMGTGIDKIDLEALKRHQVAFTHTPGVNKRSVSELVLGLIFTLFRHLPKVNADVSQGSWQQPKGRLLSNKTVGIIGFGAIGQDLAKLLSIFDCRCLFFDVRTYDHSMSHVRQVELGTLLKDSDIISLHIPFIPENRYFIGDKELTQMKKGAVLINTARGGLVDEEALYAALNCKHISAAALDVFENEPKIPKKLLTLENFFATSHIAGSTEEAIEAMGIMAIENLENLKIE